MPESIQQLHEQETKAPHVAKNTISHWSKVKRELSKKSCNDTAHVLELVRNLSNQGEHIEGDPGMSFVISKLLKFSEERRSTHSASQRHFDRLNAVFFWPSIILTSLTSATSFVSSYFPEKNTLFNVGIGIMASLSTLIVALSETYRYGSKAEQHGLASESYENLRTKLFFKSVQLQAHAIQESENENKEPALTKCETKAFFTSVEDQITEIARQCKNLVPNSIVLQYKENRYDSIVESLARNLKTVIVQDEFSKIIDKLANGVELTSADHKKISTIDKQAKATRKKRILLDV